MPKAEPFLSDIARSKVKTKTLTYQDGLRFGLGFAIGNLLIAVLLGGLAWGLVLALHLH